MSQRLTPRQEALVNDHIEYARRLSWKFVKDYHVPQEEALSLAYLGLVQAAKKYDPSRGDFTSFAYLRIRGSIIDWIRKEDPRTRAQVASDAERPQFVYLDASVHDDWTLENYDILGTSRVSDPDATLDVWRSLNRLDPRSQKILVGLASGVSGVEIGEQLGITESRVSQIATKAREKLERMVA